MDTREKIVPLNEIAARLDEREWLAVVGLFDPLTAVQAKRVAELRANDQRNILAIVLTATDTLLSADARAVLVAALRDIDLVTIAEGDAWGSVIGDNARVRIVEDSESERARSADFVRFVIEKHECADVPSWRSA